MVVSSDDEIDTAVGNEKKAFAIEAINKHLQERMAGRLWAVLNTIQIKFNPIKLNASIQLKARKKGPHFWGDGVKS